MQIIKYGIIQIGAYAIDFLVFIIFYEILDVMYIYSNTLSKVIACFVAFFAHKYFTFKSKESVFREIIKYFAFLPLNIILGTMILGLMLNSNFDYKLAKFTSDILVFFISFLLAQKLIFNSSQKSK
jgi:putative flippase GtrA